MTYLYGETLTLKQLQNANVEIDYFCRKFVISRRISGKVNPYFALCQDFSDCQNFNAVLEKLLEGLPADSVVYLTQNCIKAVTQIVESNKKDSRWFTNAKF